MTSPNNKQVSAEEQRAREENFILAEYTSLREEILKRIELQHQLILGTLVAIGTILTISTQGGALTILLVYPFLAMFLALSWSQNDHRNRQITRHLSQSEKFFLKNPLVGWEHSRKSSRLWFLGSRKVFAARGIFVGSQLLTVLLFWLSARAANQTIGTKDTILLIADGVIILLTLLIIGFPSRGNTPKKRA